MNVVINEYCKTSERIHVLLVDGIFIDLKIRIYLSLFDEITRRCQILYNLCIKGLYRSVRKE